MTTEKEKLTELGTLVLEADDAIENDDPVTAQECILKMIQILGYVPGPKWVKQQ